MSEIRKLVVGDTTEAAIRLLFTQRIAQESNDPSHSTVNRAIRIKDLRSQIMGFIKRNPNSNFELIVPEYKSEKEIKLVFDNFTSDGSQSDNDISRYRIIINDNFVEAEIIHRVIVGRDIVLKIKAQV